MDSGDLHIEVTDGQIILTRPGTNFRATYEKPSKQPYLLMMSGAIEPNATTDSVFKFRARAFQLEFKFRLACSAAESLPD